MDIKFNRPVTIKGKEATKVSLDLEKLTGNDMIKAEEEARSMGDTTPVITLSMRYQAAVAARAIGCPVDDVLALPGGEFTQVIARIANFLLK